MSDVHMFYFDSSFTRCRSPPSQFLEGDAGDRHAPSAARSRRSRTPSPMMIAPSTHSRRTRFEPSPTRPEYEDADGRRPRSHRLGQSRDIAPAESLHIIVVLLLRSFYQQDNLLVHPTENVHLSVFQLICQVIQTTVLLLLHTYPP